MSPKITGQTVKAGKVWIYVKGQVYDVDLTAEEMACQSFRTGSHEADRRRRDPRRPDLGYRLGFYHKKQELSQTSDAYNDALEIEAENLADAVGQIRAALAN